MKRQPIDEIIKGHEERNETLRGVFNSKNIDLNEPRTIECHFWTWSQESADALADALRKRGFTILALRPAVIDNDPKRWNLEVSVRQSIDLTMRYEFTDELARLADSNGGLYDGWGTQI